MNKLLSKKQLSFMYKNNAETEYLKLIKKNQQMEQLKQNEYEQLNYTQMQQTKIFKKPEKIDLDKYKYISQNVQIK